MPKVKVYNLKAEETGTMTLKDEVFNVEYNEPVIHEVVVAYMANQRQGNKSFLNRREVRGHAKKPWAQKHTGRARQGSRKGPQWTGGGQAFALKPRDFSKKVNKQTKRLAFVSAISQKVKDNELFVLKDVVIEQAKTKYVQDVLNNFKFDKKTLIIIDQPSEMLSLASRNLQDVEVVNYDLVNVYQLVAHKNVLATKEAIKKIEEAYVE
jgi:large subunit ribosomal protein L4